MLLAIPICTIFVMLENHYTRDTVGALEKQMESDLGLSPAQYSTLNSLYFMPNIIAPLFIGILCEKSGRPSTFLLYTVLVGSLGNIVFVLGAEYSNLSLFYVGRFLAGCVYEVIDTIPIIILGPLYRSNWGLMVGIMNGSLRLGTVFTFAVSPVVYEHSGVVAALWLAAFMAVLGVAAAVGANIADVRLHALLLGEDEEAPPRETELTVMTHSYHTFAESDEALALLSNDLNRQRNASVRTSLKLPHSQHNAPASPLRDAPVPSGGRSRGQSRDLSSLPEEEYYHPHITPETEFSGVDAVMLRGEAFRIAPRSRSHSRADEHQHQDHREHVDPYHHHNHNEDAELRTTLLREASGNPGLSPSDPAVSYQHRDSVLERLGLNATPPLVDPTDKTDADAVSLWQYVCDASPIRDYGTQFYMYLLNGVFLFGAMVPFWFIGSKFFQVNYSLTVQQADFLMLMPEGAMVVVSPCLGLVLDWLCLPLKYKLCLLGAACLGMTCAFCMLAFGYSLLGPVEGDVLVHLNPLYAMVILGSSYACANSLTWDTIVHIVPHPDQLAPASGLCASAVNILPSLIPYLIIYLTTQEAARGAAEQEGRLVSESNVGMLVLAATAVVAGAFAFGAACCKKRRYDADYFDSDFVLKLNARRQKNSAEQNYRLSNASEYDII